MDYYDILQLNREPFSNSPDPDFFFQSRAHQSCLQKLELSLRLRRGLNIVVGPVGSGKTTLCRQLLRNFTHDDRFSSHLILDPQFENERDFLQTVVAQLAENAPGEEASLLIMKEQIKQHLFRKGVEEEKVVVLIIDEGQKIPLFCLEILREFLNYETNTYKLLQIVIFAQSEFESVLRKYENLADRINLFHRLGPLGFSDTRAMIRYRIQQACDAPDVPHLFTVPALWAIHRSGRGYPRKIVQLCHQSLLAMIVQNQQKVDWFIARACIRRRLLKKTTGWKKLTAATALAALAVLLWGLKADLRIPMPMGKQKIATTNPRMQSATPNSPSAPARAASLSQQSLDAEIGPDLEPEKPIQNTPPFQKIGESDTNQAQGITGQVAPDPIRTPSPKAPEQDTVAVSAMETSVAAASKSGPETTIVVPKPVLFSFPDDPEPEDAAVEGLIGTAAAGVSEPLSQFIQNVYGLFNKSIMARVLAANPQISNPDRIMAGQKIRFPAITAREKPLAVGRCWIEIMRYKTLDRAIDAIRSLPPSIGFSARLIPFHTAGDGYRFSVIVKEYFAGPANAKSRLMELQNVVGPQAVILTHWDPGTVFYSDPYSGRIQRQSDKKPGGTGENEKKTG